MRKRILITGAHGQLGRECALTLGAATLTRSEVVALGRADCDLGSPQALRRAVRKAAPDVILNCAAYTNVNGAEEDREGAYAINALAPGILAEEALRLGALLVHFSTDYVFDGAKADAYVEQDATHPLNVYGASKLAGEEAIAAVGGEYYVLRTSWLYSAHGQNFVRTMLKLGREREVLRVVDDQVGAPTATRQLAQAVQRMLVSENLEAASGVYHLTAAGQVSWCGLARQVFARARAGRLGAGLMVREVVGVSSDEFPSPAQRPLHSALSNARFREKFQFSLEPWQEALDAVLLELGA